MKNESTCSPRKPGTYQIETRVTKVTAKNVGNLCLVPKSDPDKTGPCI